METVTFKPSEVFKEKADQLFAEQHKVLSEKFPEAFIEHIGGTAIPNLLTKGDLDINVRVPEAQFQEVVDTLKDVYHINQPDNWAETYASFKDDDSFDLPLGIQVTVIDSPDDYFVKQRDALLDDLSLVEKFNNLKMLFEGKDMDAYREAKGKFLDKNL